MTEMATPSGIRTFDWRPNPDPRSADFHVKRRSAAVSARESRTWTFRSPVLDQASEGACVGFGVTKCATQSRYGNRLYLPDPTATARGMYYGSRRIDEWEGEGYDGTSVNAGCKLARELGLIDGWEWCTSWPDVVYAMKEIGPVVFGLWWPEGLASPDPVTGFAEVTGADLGGHCVCAKGVYDRRKVGPFEGRLWQIEQSWGTGHGKAGRIFVPDSQLRTLFMREGEAVVLRPRTEVR